MRRTGHSHSSSLVLGSKDTPCILFKCSFTQHGIIIHIIPTLLAIVYKYLHWKHCRHTCCLLGQEILLKCTDRYLIHFTLLGYDIGQVVLLKGIERTQRAHGRHIIFRVGHAHFNNGIGGRGIRAIVIMVVVLSHAIIHGTRLIINITPCLLFECFQGSKGRFPTLIAVCGWRWNLFATLSSILEHETCA